MKVTPDDVIRLGEQELIDSITADLDWEAVETLFRERHRLPLGEDVAYKNGDLVVHENRIAYLLEFEVKVPLSMLLDRQGNCITIETDPGATQVDGPPSIEGADEVDSVDRDTPAAADSNPEKKDDAPDRVGCEPAAEMDSLPPREAEEDPDMRIAQMASDAQEALSDLEGVR